MGIGKAMGIVKRTPWRSASVVSWFVGIGGAIGDREEPGHGREIEEHEEDGGEEW